MGKGKASYVYYCDIYAVDFAKRQFQATLQPIGASVYSLSNSGYETLFLDVLWKRLPYIRYRLEKALQTEEDKLIEKSVGSATYDNIDISKFAYDRKQKGVTRDGSSSLSNAWRELSAEEKQPYIDYSNNKKQEVNLLVRKLIKEQNLPPLAELSIDDICGNLNKIAWRYIQKVIVEYKPKDETGKQIPSGRYTVIVTDPKWLIGVKEGHEGTTSYEQELGKIVWTKELHHYFPVSFRERTKILLMMRLPQHATTNPIGMLPEPLFLLMLQYLAVMAYEEDSVDAWEIALRTNITKRVLEIHESVMEEHKPRR